MYKAIEVLLKGPEISLTDHEQPAYLDKDGNPRKKARIRWWNDDAATLRDIAVMEGDFTTSNGEPYPALPDIDVDSDARSYVYHRYRAGVLRPLLAAGRPDPRPRLE